MKVRMLDGSGERTYKYAYEDMDRHGNVRVYFCIDGKQKIRLREQPGSEAFDREYRHAFRGEASPARIERRATGDGTMRWLCERYYVAPAFTGLGPDTRRVRRRILDATCERVGNFHFADMEPKDVVKLRDEKADFPEAANARVKALRQLFSWATDPQYGHATRNPARDVRYLKSKNPDGHREWTEVEVAQYEARHPIGTKARLTLDLFLYTGVRISDVVKLGPQMERDGKLVFTEGKGEANLVKTHALPILPPLRASIDATPSGQLVYLATKAGKPHSVKAFGNWFGDRCREAGIAPGFTAHGLRKCGANRCAEAGATESQLMALFGWTTSKQAAHYTRKANRRKLEAAAAPMLMAEQNSTKVSHFSPGLSPVGEKGRKNA